MIVYVETNFILELAFEQNQDQAVDEIIKLAERDKINLAFPGFSISESLSKVTRQSRDREEFRKSLVKELQKLRESRSYQQSVRDLDPALELLQNVISKEPDRLISVLEQVLQVGTLLELDSSSFSQAQAYKVQLGTSIEDSIIYSAIISDLKYRPRKETKLFLSKDAKAFGGKKDKKKADVYQLIEVELESYGCKYIPGFKDGLGYIESELRKAG